MPEIDFYGIKRNPPTRLLAESFGATEEPIHLPGGQNTNYKSGNTVFKPSDNDVFSNWLAEVFRSLPETPDVRFARPIQSIHGTWVHNGYVAWAFLEGQHIKGEYDKKLSTSMAFHKLLKDIPKPDFLGQPNNSWSVGDLVAWQKIEFDYIPEFMEYFEQIKPHLRPLASPNQLIHGDLSGNFLYDPNQPPAIIDFSPAWAPTGFAEGIMLADAIAWENAKPEELNVFKEIPDFDQFAWRGVLRRITEQAEHMKWFDKDKDQALEEANVYQKAINYLKENYGFKCDFVGGVGK